MLHAIRSSRNQAEIHQIPLNFVYKHPSIQKLGDYFWRVLSATPDVSEQDRANQIERRCLEMESLVTKYAASIPMPQWQVLPGSRREETILLTGSTGRFGCYILGQLAERDDIVKIYALNRSNALNISPEARQTEAMKTWGLSLNSDAVDKIVFLEYDPSEEKLGLTEDDHSMVKRFSCDILCNVDLAIASKNGHDHNSQRCEPFLSSVPRS